MLIIFLSSLFYSAHDCIFCVRCLVRDRDHLLTRDDIAEFFSLSDMMLEKNQISENIHDHTYCMSGNSGSDFFQALLPRSCGQERGAADTTVSK